LPTIETLSKIFVGLIAGSVAAFARGASQKKRGRRLTLRVCQQREGDGDHDAKGDFVE